MFGAFCLWGALDNGLPQDSDMWFLAGVGTFLVLCAGWIVYAWVQHRKAERPEWERENNRPSKWKIP
jgi:hypothetical protein